MKRIFYVIVGLLLINARLFAQKSTVLTSGTSVSTATSGLSSFISNFSVSSTFNAGQNARAELKYTTDNWWTLGFSVDQKLSSSVKDQTSPIDFLNGPAAGTKLGVNFQKMFWNPKMSDASFDDFNRAADLYAARKGVERRTVTRNDILSYGTEQEKALLKPVKVPVFFNLHAFVEKTSFSYATDSVKLAEIEESHFAPSVLVSLMVPNVNKQAFWIASYSYTETYKAASDVDFMSPFGTTNNYFSQTLAFGAPKKSYNHKAVIEYRKGFKKGDKVVAILDPSVSWGSSNHKVNFVLPVYVIPGVDDKGKATGLQGGITFGYSGYSTEKGEWTSFADGFGAQLFIATPFDIFSNLK